jgi:hypothetical protein
MTPIVEQLVAVTARLVASGYSERPQSADDAVRGVAFAEAQQIVAHWYGPPCATPESHDDRPGDACPYCGWPLSAHPREGGAS